MTNDNQQRYKDLAMERMVRLEVIGETLHPWTHDRDLGNEIDVLEMSRADDEEMMRFLQ